MSDNHNENKVESLITTGSEMVGAAASGILGFILGGPLGAAGGAAAGGVAGVAISKTTSKILIDVANRSLSHREEVRIGAAATLAIEKIKRKLDAGEQPRNDEFFQSQKNSSRSDAEEIFEGVLLKSKNEHEEKKVKVFASIFANIAFHSEISIGEANHILQIAENLTYRQMCLLSMFQRQAEMPIKFKEDDYREFRGSISYENISILQEIYQLYNFGLLACRVMPLESQTGPLGGYKGLLAWDDVELKKMELTSLGRRYYFFMDLDEIPLTDIEAIISSLSSVDSAT